MMPSGSVQSIIKKRLSAAVFLVLYVIAILPFGVSAAGKDLIRVGLFDRQALYSVDASQKPRGYLIDYLNQLNRYVNGDMLEFEFVYGSPETLYKMLLNGSLDLTYSAGKENQEPFLYSDCEIAIMQQALYVSNHNRDIFYEDYNSFQGLHIGLLNDSADVERFRAFGEKHGFLYTQEFFKNIQQMRQALSEGRIDAAAATGSNATMNKIAAKIQDVPVYLCSAPNQTELMDKINQAQSALLEDQPYLQAKLDNEYNETSHNYALTRREADYVNASLPVRVVCAPNNQPLEYYEKASGEYRGIYVDLLSCITEKCGLQFEFLSAASYADAVEQVSAGRADLLLSTYRADNFARERGLMLTEPYTQSYMVMIGKYGSAMAEDGVQTIAVDLSYSGIAYYLKEWYPNWSLRYYNSVEECVQAVRDGLADFTLQDSNLMEALFIENQYHDIGPVTAGRYQADIGMAVSGGCSTVLVDVLNKAINAVSEAEYNTCVAQNQNAPIGAERFYKQYRSYIQIAVSLLLLGILLLVAVFQFRLYRIAYHDKLTHCKNGSYLLERGNRLIKRGRFTYVVSLDVKKMKQINDSYGMNTGNDVLAFVAAELKKRLPKGGRVIRNTADNYVLLLPARGMTQQRLMDKLTELFMELRDYQQGEVSVKLYFSAGICRIQRNHGLSESLNHADIARKTAKETGRTVLFFDVKIKAKMNREREIEDSMEQALENQEFEVYYQPKFHMGTGEIVGAEALVRWNSPSKGFLSPIEFIPIFEKNGFVMQLDFYVLKHVCATLRQLLEAGVRPLPVSVNQSRTHINDPQYVEKLRKLISEYRLPSGFLELELTEYLFMENESVVGILHKIKDMGLLLSIDDFGSGYSSLNLLRDIPIDYLKIDKGFLRELQLSDKTKVILTRIIQMANDLGITPVCEGVETREQAGLLKNMGCLLCQGYLYARPMPEKEYLKLAYHLEGAAAYV